MALQRNIRVVADLLKVKRSVLSKSTTCGFCGFLWKPGSNSLFGGNFFHVKNHSRKTLATSNTLQQFSLVDPNKSMTFRNRKQCRYSRMFSTCKANAAGADKRHSWLTFSDPALNWDYLLDVNNKEAIRENIHNRKGVGDIDKLHALLEEIQQAEDKDITKLKEDFIKTALEIPNISHPDSPIGDESEAVTKTLVGGKQEFDFEPQTVDVLGEHLDTLRTKNVSLTTGDNTYYLKGAFAMLEQALVRYTVDVLKKKGFHLFSVPDLLYPHIIEGCGFKTTGVNQVYKLRPEIYGRVCLSGTGEMPLAGFCMNQVWQARDLPQRMMAVSQCYRAEASNTLEEHGIYRVHHFLKVEMFGLTTNSGVESEEMLEDFINIETELFTNLGLHFRVLDMPTHELGASAHRKYDIEAWMPGKKAWGEISSASNCTDYQSRRLSAQYEDTDGSREFCHTVNGTACAVPRMILAIAETNQNQDMTIEVPRALQPYMRDMEKIVPRHDASVMKPIRYTRTLKKTMHSQQV